VEDLSSAVEELRCGRERLQRYVRRTRHRLPLLPAVRKVSMYSEYHTTKYGQFYSRQTERKNTKWQGERYAIF
jgi:hypothetical protein